VKKLLWLCTQPPPDRPELLRRRWETLPELALAAVANGFAGFMSSEHHWREDGYCPDSLALVTALGAVARPELVGTAIVPLPMTNPHSLVERGALAAAITGAEVLLGVGTGNDPLELATGGWDPGHLGAATESAITSVLGGSARNGLHQAFGPPRVLLGAMTHAGVRRAGRMGLGWIADPRCTLAQLKELRSVYRDSGGTGPIIVMRTAHIGEDDGWPVRAYAEYQRFWARRSMVGLGVRGELPRDEFLREVVIAGDRQKVSDSLAVLDAELGAYGVCLSLSSASSEIGAELEQLPRWAAT
jgi:alkanesulfonate monooxygenase SsuD/methylene tetrahydromethanopterin reductase-like flavin-dependent oxidoreductase (luciferase family)